MKKLLVKHFLVKIGGEQHKGWLPNNVAKPLVIPIRKLYFNFEIEEQEKQGGFLLIYQSQNNELYGDTWHRTEKEAIEVANECFNVPEDLWKEIK